MRYAIGLDIGGTKCAVTVGSKCDGQIKVLRKQGFATNEVDTADAFFQKVFGKIDSFKTQYNFDAVGISCGGPLNEKTGVIICPPHLPLLHNTKDR